MPHPFHFPQPAPVEQKPRTSIEDVLREHVAYTAAARAETRQARLEIKELTMKVSELSSLVETLIGVATNIKSTADNAAANHAAEIPQDDPEVEALGARIKDAIAVLQGSTPGTTLTSPATPAPYDPNAPV